MVTLGPACPTSIWPLEEQSSSAPPTQQSTWPGLAKQDIHPPGHRDWLRVGRRPKQTQQDSLAAYGTPPLLLGVAKLGEGEQTSQHLGLPRGR